MLIEFIGSTGSGKTTLIRQVERRLAGVEGVTSAADLVTGLVGLRRVSHPAIRNLIQEIVSFPFFVSSLCRYGAFAAHTARLSLRNARLGMVAVSNVRSLERKLGVYALVRQQRRRRIVLVDEGPMQAAHMFVRVLASVTTEEIARFVDLLPMADAVVHVRAPVDAVVRRTLQRADTRREIRSHDPAQVARYVEAAAELFDQLVRTTKVADRVLVVDNPDLATKDQEAVTERIATFIMSHRHETLAPVPEAAASGG